MENSKDESQEACSIPNGFGHFSYWQTNFDKFQKRHSVGSLDKRFGSKWLMCNRKNKKTVLWIMFNSSFQKVVLKKEDWSVAQW